MSNPFYTIPNEIAMFEDGEIPFEEDDEPFAGACDHVIDAMADPMNALRKAIIEVRKGGSAYDVIPLVEDVLDAWYGLAGEL